MYDCSSVCFCLIDGRTCAGVQWMLCAEMSFTFLRLLHDVAGTSLWCCMCVSGPNSTTVTKTLLQIWL